MKIIQVSDLHFGAHNKQLATALQERIAREQPDLVVATGDLADNPDATLLGQAKEFLNRLAQCCRPGLDVNAPRLIAVPGNHDRLGGGWWFGRGDRLFEAIFDAVVSHYYFAGERVWVYGLDSTDPKVLGTGKVTRASLERFYGEYQRLGAVEPRFGDAFKLVLVHHHPLPVNADRDWRERALMMVDAGQFLGAMMDCGVDLVLHGHEHLQGSARLRDLPAQGHLVHYSPAARPTAAGR